MNKLKHLFYLALLFAPLKASAFILDVYGQRGAAIVLLFTSLGIFILVKISMWYKRQLEAEKLSKIKKVLVSSLPPLTKKQVGIALAILFTIIFARSFYTTNITSFYVFYLMEHYGLTLKVGQVLIFTFMACGVVGTFFGGPLSDRIGRKNVIVLSVIVPIPLCLILPYMPLWAVPILLVIIGISTDALLIKLNVSLDFANNNSELFATSFIS